MTYSRTSPYRSHLLERHLLTPAPSTRSTYHLRLSAPLPYKVGDSAAILPSNDPTLVEGLLSLLSLSPTTPYTDARHPTEAPLLEHLLHRANLDRPSPAALKLFPPEAPKESSLLDLLKTFPRPQDSLDLIRRLLPLLPRFYSIASSPLLHPDEIHLTVAHLCYTTPFGPRFGVGSHFLCALADPLKTPIPLYIQPSNHFTLPSDPNAPLLLIGPGTGVAPFRAFLQERLATRAPGKQWLFFGERHAATDFYYRDFWEGLEREGLLRLTTAFSRDQEEKIYVQHRLYEHREEVWEWLEQGAYLYLCGDADQMAKDVEVTLFKIAREVGHLTEEGARHYFKKMRQEKRFLLDVY